MHCSLGVDVGLLRLIIDFRDTHGLQSLPVGGDGNRRVHSADGLLDSPEVVMVFCQPVPDDLIINQVQHKKRKQVIQLGFHHRIRDHRAAPHHKMQGLHLFIGALQVPVQLRILQLLHPVQSHRQQDAVVHRADIVLAVLAAFQVHKGVQRHGQ